MNKERRKRILEEAELIEQARDIARGADAGKHRGFRGIYKQHGRCRQLRGYVRQ